MKAKLHGHVLMFNLVKSACMIATSLRPIAQCVRTSTDSAEVHFLCSGLGRPPMWGVGEPDIAPLVLMAARTTCYTCQSHPRAQAHLQQASPCSAVSTCCAALREWCIIDGSNSTGMDAWGRCYQVNAFAPLRLLGQLSFSAPDAPTHAADMAATDQSEAESRGMHAFPTIAPASAGAAPKIM